VKVITAINEKGGVGRTTITTHIAAWLAIRGYRVLIIDADPQGNATGVMNLPKRPDFYDLLVRGAKWKSVVQQVHPDVYSPPNAQAQGTLLLVSSNVETRNIANSISKPGVVRQRFQELQNVVDFIIVDTSPTPSLLHAAITLASDYVIIPTSCETFSALEGVPDSLNHVGDVRTGAMERSMDVARVIGIIPNMYRSNTITHSEMVKYLQEQYGDLVWDTVDMSIKIAEAQLKRQFLYGLYPNSSAAQQMQRIANRIEAVVHEQAN
jgi:chromosome partitioning protein